MTCQFWCKVFCLCPFWRICWKYQPNSESRVFWENWFAFKSGSVALEKGQTHRILIATYIGKAFIALSSTVVIINQTQLFLFSFYFLCSKANKILWTIFFWWSQRVVLLAQENRKWNGQDVHELKMKEWGVLVCWKRMRA